VGQFQNGLYENLKLYVRQSAWLNATRERPKNDKSDKPRISRIEQMRLDRGDDDYQPEMPPVDAEYLLTYLWEIGPTMAAGGYPGPITHEELRSWQANTGIELEPWEVRFLRRLSGEYIAESHRAEKADCPAPWSQEGKPQVSAVAQALQASIRAMADL